MLHVWRCNHRCSPQDWRSVFFLITWLRVPEMFLKKKRPGHQLCSDTYTWTQAIIAVEMLHPVMSFCDGADCDHAAFSDVWSASITLLFAWEDVGIVHTEARHGMGCSMVVFFCVDYYLGSIFNSRWATSVPSQVQNFECWYIPGVSSLVPSLCFLISFGKHCTESTSAIFECFWGEGSTLDCCNFPWDLSEHLGIPWWCQLAKRNSQLSGWVQVMCSVTTHFKRLDMVSGDHDSAWPGSCYWCWCPRMTCLQNIDVSVPLVFFKFSFEVFDCSRLCFRSCEHGSGAHLGVLHACLRESWWAKALSRMLSFNLWSPKIGLV